MLWLGIIYKEDAGPLQLLLVIHSFMTVKSYKELKALWSQLVTKELLSPFVSLWGCRRNKNVCIQWKNYLWAYLNLWGCRRNKNVCVQWKNYLSDCDRAYELAEETKMYVYNGRTICLSVLGHVDVVLSFPSAQVFLGMHKRSVSIWKT